MKEPIKFIQPCQEVRIVWIIREKNCYLRLGIFAISRNTMRESCESFQVLDEEVCYFPILFIFACLLSLS